MFQSPAVASDLRAPHDPVISSSSRLEQQREERQEKMDAEKRKAEKEEEDKKVHFSASTKCCV